MMWIESMLESLPIILDENCSSSVSPDWEEMLSELAKMKEAVMGQLSGLYFIRQIVFGLLLF